MQPLAITMGILVLILSNSGSVDPLDRVITELNEKATHLNAASGDFRAVVEDRFDSNLLKITLTGTFEYALVATSPRFRYDLKATALVRTNGSEKTSELQLILYGDEQYLWTVNLTENRAEKNWSSAEDLRIALPQAFQLLRKNHTLSLGSDARIGGEAVYVVLAESKESDPNERNKTRYSFSKSSGILLECGEKQGQSHSAKSTLRDIRLDPTIDPSRLEFIPAPGMEIIDLTIADGARPPGGAPTTTRPTQSSSAPSRTTQKSP